jgi:hypothetical protein
MQLTLYANVRGCMLQLGLLQSPQYFLLTHDERQTNFESGLKQKALLPFRKQGFYFFT